MSTAKSSGWLTTTGTVTSSEYRYAKLRDINEDEVTGLDQSYFIVGFRYVVDGQMYEGAFESKVDFAIDSTIAVIYDPGSPARNCYTATKHSLKSRIFGLAAGILIVWLLYHFGLLGHGLS